MSKASLFINEIENNDNLKDYLSDCRVRERAHLRDTEPFRLGNELIKSTVVMTEVDKHGDFNIHYLQTIHYLDSKKDPIFIKAMDQFYPNEDGKLTLSRTVYTPLNS